MLTKPPCCSDPVVRRPTGPAAPGDQDRRESDRPTQQMSLVVQPARNVLGFR
ncbi:hypothetical protein [Hymenobacter koreensis]|uniref:hypothetical protein n=1 Tax=Hymenobacter koreensis TaxID=1084523 RepID=UPI0031EE62B3